MAGSGDAELQGQRRRIAWLATLFAMVGLVISVRRAVDGAATAPARRAQSAAQPDDHIVAAG